VRGSGEDGGQSAQAPQTKPTTHTLTQPRQTKPKPREPRSTPLLTAHAPEQSDGEELVVGQLAGLGGLCHACEHLLQVRAVGVRGQAVGARQRLGLRLQPLCIGLVV